MDQLVGSIYAISELPIWATAGILFAVVLATLPIGRDILEGMPYNVSYSSAVGDAGFIIGILIAATVLQRGGSLIPEWLQSPTIHVVILLASIALGWIVCVITLSSRDGRMMDIYHDVVIFPIFVYSGITLVPIIYINGTKIEIIAMLCLMLLWIALSSFDVKHGRLNQREYLRRHGVTLTN